MSIFVNEGRLKNNNYMKVSSVAIGVSKMGIVMHETIINLYIGGK